MGLQRVGRDLVTKQQLYVWSWKQPHYQAQPDLDLPILNFYNYQEMRDCTLLTFKETTFCGWGNTW